MTNKPFRMTEGPFRMTGEPLRMTGVYRMTRAYRTIKSVVILRSETTKDLLLRK